VGHWGNGAMIKEWLFWDNVIYMRQIAIGEENSFEDTRSIRLVYNEIEGVLI
jgi:hypothetical protein